MEPDSEFEAWYESTGFSQHCQWNPELGRYISMTIKQSSWEVWQAAKKSTLQSCAEVCRKLELTSGNTPHTPTGFTCARACLALGGLR